MGLGTILVCLRGSVPSLPRRALPTELLGALADEQNKTMSSPTGVSNPLVSRLDD